MDLISVIIPVFNSEQYVEQCIHSILDQSLHNIEVIIINDGSTDATPFILQRLAAEDERIILLSQANKGVSCARNLGLVQASGSHVAFVDSDDYVSADYLATLLHYMTEADFVVSGISKSRGNQVYAQTGLGNQVWQLEDERQFVDFINLPYMTSVCSKLYNTDLIRRHHIRFSPDITYGEDRVFNLAYLQHVQRAVSISAIGYYYRRGICDSLSHQPVDIFHQDVVFWSQLQNLCTAKGFSGEPVRRMLANRLFHIVCDKIAENCSVNEGIFKIICACHRDMGSIDFTFLKRHCDLISVPYWLRFLVLNRHYVPLYLINKFTG